MFFRILVLLLVPTLFGCFPSYENIDVDQAVIDADKVFKLYPEYADILPVFPEGVAYLTSLNPRLIFISESEMSLTLNRRGVESAGIKILRKGHSLKKGGGTNYKKLSDRVYRFENRG